MVRDGVNARCQGITSVDILHPAHCCTGRIGVGFPAQVRSSAARRFDGRPLFHRPFRSTNTSKWSFDKPDEHKVFLQHAGIFDVAKIQWMVRKIMCIQLR